MRSSLDDYAARAARRRAARGPGWARYGDRPADPDDDENDGDQPEEIDYSMAAGGDDDADVA